MVRAKHSPSRNRTEIYRKSCSDARCFTETKAKVAVRAGNGVPRGTSLRPFLRDWGPYEDVTSLRDRNRCGGSPFPLRIGAYVSCVLTSHPQCDPTARS